MRLNCKTQKKIWLTPNPQHFDFGIHVPFVQFLISKLERTKRNLLKNDSRVRKLSIVRIQAIKITKHGVKWFYMMRGIHWW